MKNKLFLLDVLPILYRSHFAMQHQPLINSKGLNTSAILGFCNYLFQIIFKEKPTHLVVAFDSYSSDRKQTLTSYKAHREKMPEDIAVAKDYVKRILNALNILSIEIKGFEADDIIGTIAQKAAKAGFEVFIVSPDKDFAQLASSEIFLYKPSYKGLNFEILDREKVKEKYGVAPHQIPDLLALKGDAADNIPGVPRIGEKSAINLLEKFSNLEDLLERKEEVTPASIRKSLVENEETAKLSKQLAMINTELPIEFTEESYRLKSPESEKLIEVLDDLELARLKERIASSTLYKKDFERIEKTNLDKQHSPPCALYVLEGETALENVLHRVKQAHLFYFITQMKDEDIAMSFLADGKIYLSHFKSANIPSSLLDLLQSDEVEKITYNIKPLLKLLLSKSLKIKGLVSDLMLAHYIASPDASHLLDKIMAQELGVTINNSHFEEQLCMETKMLVDVHSQLFAHLQATKQLKLYHDIELPLTNVLAKMELNGINIDVLVLQEVSEHLREESEKSEKQIYELAGEKFNLRSSKQIAQQLSKLMGNAAVRKTKTGQLSTSEASLLTYAKENDVARHLLRYRQLGKLLSTYTESLPTFINPVTKRLHPECLQTATATGRLSYSNPSLQNIPTPLEVGGEIRRVVIPENHDFLILSAEYNQLEFRLLAALSQEQSLVRAFAENLDIHTFTAAKIFNVADSAVTHDMRSKAETLNEGVSSGLSTFQLSQQLHMTMPETREITVQYYLHFPNIKKFIDSTIDFARRNTYSLTLTGRRRTIENINSRNRTVRKAAEHIAITTSLQGLAADLIKISMIEIDKELSLRNRRSKMIFQVHEELVFEAYKPELNELMDLVKEKMQNVLDVAIPIEVILRSGDNWMEVK